MFFLLIYMSTTVTPPVLYKQIMNDNIVKYRCDFIKYYTVIILVIEVLI